jgi:hypothetical protein
MDANRDREWTRIQSRHKTADPEGRIGWPDDLNFKDVSGKGILGHRQVTDAYLVALAAKHKARVATMDEGLFALHPALSLLIPRRLKTTANGHEARFQAFHAWKPSLRPTGTPIGRFCAMM